MYLIVCLLIHLFSIHSTKFFQMTAISTHYRHAPGLCPGAPAIHHILTSSWSHLPEMSHSLPLSHRWHPAPYLHQTWLHPSSFLTHRLPPRNTIVVFIQLSQPCLSTPFWPPSHRHTSLHSQILFFHPPLLSPHYGEQSVQPLCYLALEFTSSWP